MKSKATVIRREADISFGEMYRYSLRRVFAGGWRGQLGWVMCNPSTADAEVDDPTMRRVIDFTYREGFSSCYVVNVFSYRTPQPTELVAAHSQGVDVWGPGHNMAHDALRHCEAVVFAWGALPSQLADDTIGLVSRWPEALCLGRTKAGHPRHPLYLKADTPYERFRR